MKQKIIIFTLIFFVSFSKIFGQNGVLVSGNVKSDDESSCIAISVGLQGTTYGSQTDEKGHFEFYAKPGKYILKLSSLNHETLEMPVKIEAGKKNYFPNIRIKSKVEDIDEVVVTGTKTCKSLSNAPILTKLVSEKEIEQAGCVSALDAIETVMPGIQFSPDPHGDNMSIQGLDNSYVLVLLDGERMVGETRGNVNFDRISASDIQQIEIISGASSVLYGSNAIGGVINIITKKSKKRFEGKVDSRYSNFNTLSSNIRLGTKQEKYSIRFSGFRNSSDGYDLSPETPEIFTANPYVDYSATLKVKYNPVKRLAIEAHGTYFIHESLNPEKSIKSSHMRYHDYTVGGKIAYDFSEDHNLILGINTDQYDANSIFEKLNDSISKKSDFRYHTINLTDRYEVSDKLELINGVEMNFENIYSESLFGINEDKKDKRKYSNDFNVFSQADWKLIKKLELIAGVRYTRHTTFGNHFTPNLSLMYSPIQRLKLRGTAAYGYKSPSVKELYYNFDHQGMFYIFGNKDLKPENSRYASLSAEYTYHKVNISVSAYHNLIDNKIEMQYVYNDVLNQNEYHHGNINKVEIQGIETSLNWALGTHFKFKTSYAFSNAIDKATNRQINGNSKHTATTALTFFTFGKRFPMSITLSGRIASPRLFLLQKENETTGEIILEELKSKPYSIWKIAYIQHLPIKGDLKADVKFGIDNILDYSDLEQSAVLDPGRIFWVGASIKF